MIINWRVRLWACRNRVAYFFFVHCRLLLRGRPPLCGLSASLLLLRGRPPLCTLSGLLLLLRGRPPLCALSGLLLLLRGRPPLCALSASLLLLRGWLLLCGLSAPALLGPARIHRCLPKGRREITCGRGVSAATQ